MKYFFKFLSIAAFLIPVFSMAADAEDATKAATEILQGLQKKSFNDVWSFKTSAWFKTKMTKESFMANMSMGRNQLGSVLAPSQFVDMAYSKSDPANAFVGEIYAFNFLSTYSAGKFYERIVVVKDEDGIFRLSGIFGAPAG